MEAHEGTIAIIEASVRSFSERQQPFRIYHGSTNSTRDSQRRLDKAVDTSKLNHVLSINKEDKMASVEPNVPMDALLQATLEHGLVPLVVMEFPGITAGGGFSSTSGESSSFRYGFFDGTVNWIEIVLANGTVTRASRTEKPDLFWGAASSFGTLGVVTLLEVRLREATNRDSKPDGRLSGRYRLRSGRLTSSLPAGASVHQFTRRSDPWFYIHVQRRCATAGNSVVKEYVPLVDYLFRYDRCGFWVGRYAFRYFITPFNRITRFLLDRFMHTRVMYHALHASGQSRMYIIQDVAVPYNAALEFQEWLDDTFNMYPLWLCPLRQRRDGGNPEARHGLYASLADPEASSEFMMNFGVWGPGSKNRIEFVRQNRLLEQKVDELGGQKWLYAHAYYTQDEFWSIYDRKAYDALRAKYGASYLPSVYEKVKVDVDAEERAIRASWVAWLLWLFWSIWPLSGLYGVYKAFRGGEYLLQKESSSLIRTLKKD
ncbi:FAD binding domain protein [Mollisia scopiformis]|uniref:Delta(24)-sterol reductase n=1 Tax=Mollisia scopiformis TaxID=149040 RepID=A0A132B5W9_MOLSC|nr:FAD binding domain protein [Mollisia scopiformis]KUJ07806.1 FAD binding domain protein [Mollisia scopiformis]